MSDALTDSDLAKLKAHYGRIAHCRYNGVDIVFRKPSMSEAQMYRSCPTDTAEQRFEQSATLAQIVLVHPSLTEWHAMMDDYPFMLSNEGVNNALARAMGVLEEKKDSTRPMTAKPPIPSASAAGSPSGSPSSPEVS